MRDTHVGPGGEHLETVTCGTCFRQERWADSEGSQAEVLMEGGGRRPAEHPQWSRGLAALAALAGETGPVVGVCAGCGQMMIAAQGSELEPMRVRVDTPRGALVVDVDGIEGPGGESLDREAAEDFLEEQYRVPFTRGLLGDVGRSTMFLGLVFPFLLWLMGIGFVLSFLASIYEGVSPSVRGLPGFDLTGPPPAQEAAP